MRAESNFFFNLSISDSEGKRTAFLTNDILRCVSKIDIVEAVASDDGQGANSANITFIESDYQPVT